MSEATAVGLDRAERAERAKRMLRKLADYVNRTAPPGLGHWPRAWEMVEEPSGRFLDAVHEWEVTGDPELVPAINVAIKAAGRAWAEAARLWIEAGKPGASLRDSELAGAGR